MRPWTLALLMAVALLGGCAGPDGSSSQGQALAATLDFGEPLDVSTTPDEANEYRGFLRVAWGEGSFAIESESEPDLARRTLVVGDELYTTATGMGWVVQDRDTAVESRKVSNRLLLWDLRGLLASGDLALSTQQEGERIRITGSGTTGPGGSLDVTLDLVARDGRVEEAEVDSTQGREGPYTFRPSTGPLGFPVERPAVARPVAEVQVLDGQAYDGHVAIIQLIQDYAAKRAGVLPDSVTPETLNVELLASGGSWPKGAYDGRPAHDADESGQFAWTRCGVTDGLYLGYGWDGPVVTQSFGAGCAG